MNRELSGFPVFRGRHMTYHAETRPNPMLEVKLSQAEKPWHALTVADVSAALETNAKFGLAQTEVLNRRGKYGENRIPAPPRPSAIGQFFAGFGDPLVIALLISAVVAAVVAMNEHTSELWLERFSDSLAILLIVSVNGILGFLQERRAEKALEALQRMAAPNAKTIRDGEVQIIEATDLVPGDLVELEAGDRVPADARLVDVRELATEEAALTGESTPVEKSVGPLTAESALAERTNMIYMGTTAVRGRSHALIVHTGAQTELGRIGAMINSVEREPTPLESRLELFGKQILIVCLAISALLFVIGKVQGTTPWTVLLLTAVSLAVAAIPEGLPAITTITLALGMQRMALRGAIVRKLPAVETLGSATVICSDKTGTLTQNAMTVRIVETVDAVYEVTGEGYSAKGEFLVDGKSVEVAPKTLLRLLETAAICNSARLDSAIDPPRMIGDPTEIALLALAAKSGLSREALMQKYNLVSELPFDSDRKRMSVVVEHEGTHIGHVKGSPDLLLPRCTHVMKHGEVLALDDAQRAQIIARCEVHASKAMRVLAFAERVNPDAADTESGLVFLGLAAMIDPPRPEVKRAVAHCHQAGIRVVMITGDHKLTAIAIAKELGFWYDDSLAMTGTELAAVPEDELSKEVDRIAVFARVTAEQKLRIVRALKHHGHIVAMTGDGVNDAPALREAQIGIAMGRGGTDVARDAADMVLADDNFATIVHAVREGRAIFRNIQKFIFFLNSSNAGLVVAVIVGSFFGRTTLYALTPLQLLWINLVTNGLPALALGVDPPEPGQMEEAPRPVNEGIISRTDYLRTLLVGILMGFSALGLYMLPDHFPRLLTGPTHAAMFAQARTMAFTLLAISPLFHAFNCRSAISSIFRVGFFTSPVLWLAVITSAAVHCITIFFPSLHGIFKTHSMSITEWAIVLSLSILPIPFVEILKLIMPAAKPALARPKN